MPADAQGASRALREWIPGEIAPQRANIGGVLRTVPIRGLFYTAWAHRDRFCAATECPLLGVKRPSLERARNVEIALYGLAVGPAECSPRLPAQWPGMVSMRAGDRPAHATEALPRAPVRLPGLFFAASNFRQPLAPFRFPDRDQVRDRGIPDRLLLAGKLSAKCG
jgi:hypothetical protein